jgi:solute carrier family 25 (mitochondrial phosphate transporter), member 3
MTSIVNDETLSPSLMLSEFKRTVLSTKTCCNNNNSNVTQLHPQHQCTSQPNWSTSATFRSITILRKASNPRKQEKKSCYTAPSRRRQQSQHLQPPQTQTPLHEVLFVPFYPVLKSKHRILPILRLYILGMMITISTTASAYATSSYCFGSQYSVQPQSYRVPPPSHHHHPYGFRILRATTTTNTAASQRKGVLLCRGDTPAQTSKIKLYMDVTKAAAATSSLSPQKQEQQQQQQHHNESTATSIHGDEQISVAHSSQHLSPVQELHPLVVVNAPTTSRTVISSTSYPDRTNNDANQTDGVLKWKDILRSKYPLYCDRNDKECLKRQQQHVTKVSRQNRNNEDATNESEVALTWSDRKNLAVASLIGLVTLTMMIVQSGPGAYRYYLAGAICATASHVIPVPIDTVKTRQQVDPIFAKMSFLQAFVTIWNQEGMKGLMAGLGPTAIGYAFEGGIKFGVYETMKPIVTAVLYHLTTLSSYFSFLQSRIVSFAICAAISGVAAAIVLCPMEALRIRIVANPNAQQRSGWFTTATRMIKSEGISSLTKGMAPMIYKQVPYTMTKNVAFDILTRYVYTTLQTTWQMTNIGPTTKFIVPFLAASAASVLSCVSSQPGDVLLSLVNAKQNDTRRTSDIIRDVLRSEKGWKGFFVGTRPRLLHVGIVVTLQLLIYDFVKRFCGIAATGIAK